MSGSASRSRGFTLLEVLGAVLVLGLFVTVLAGAAMQGLRSEGVDRRRAEASLLADQELAGVESGLAIGIIPELGRFEQEAAAPYTVVIEVVPEDVLALLPLEVREDLARESRESKTKTTSLLFDERESRVRRVNVAVEWDEAGQPYSVARTTFTFDTSGLEELFPSGEESAAETAAEREVKELEKELGQLPDELKGPLLNPEPGGETE